MRISTRLIAKNSAFNLVGQALPSIVAIIVLPFLVHSLGKERFGIFMLIWAIHGYSQFLSLRLGFALMKFASEAIYKEEKSRLSQLTWTTVSLLGGLGGIGGLALTAFAFSFFTKVFQIPEELWFEARMALLWTALLTTLTIIGTGFRSLLAAGQRFDLINLIHASSGCFRYLFALILAVAGFGLPAIMLALLLVGVLEFSAYVVSCLTIYPSVRAISVDFRSARPLLWFGGWLSVSQIVGMAIQYLDRFIIGLLLSIKYLTYYAAPVEIINRLFLLAQSLNHAAFPALSAERKSEYSLQLYARMMKFALIIVAPLAFMLSLFSKELLTFYLGMELALKSAPVLQLFAFWFLIGTLGAVTHNFVVALGYPNVVAKFRLVELPIYAGLAFWLTFTLGIQGAAIAQLVRTILEGGYVLFILQRVFPQTSSALISNRVGQAIATSGALGLGLLVAVVSGLLTQGRLIWSILILVGGLIAYGLILWRRVLSSREKKALITMVKGVIGKGVE